MIEPDTVDDWEVLELNAEHAEAAILKQVSTYSILLFYTATNFIYTNNRLLFR